MSFFRYAATDGTGVRREGTIDAASSMDALKALKARGFGQIQIQPEARRSDVSQVVPVPVTLNGAQVSSQAMPAIDVVRTRPGTDKERFFLFAQLAQQLKAGIGPARAFEELATVSLGKYRESMLEISRSAGMGKRISESMRRYPDLYPEHVCGMVRLGEEAGCLPDACQTVSQQAEDAYKFRRFHWFVGPVVIHFILAIPITLSATRGFLRFWDMLDKSGGEGDAIAMLFQAMGQTLAWPWGPISIGVYAASFIAYKWFMSDRMRLTRHRLGLRFPVFGPRARNENVALFTWALGRASQAGLSPIRSWEIAVDCAPNLEMRARLVRAGVMRAESSKLSEIIFKSQLFPEEYAPVMTTGELTGDVAGALDRLSSASKAEFDSSTQYARYRSSVWGFMGCFVTSGVIIGILWWMWYHELFGRVLKGIDNP